MRLVIIGAVAAGTSAAAKARRNSEEAEIIIYERDRYISYSGCGMPYYIGGEVERAEELTPRDPAFFKSKYNVDVITLHEVIAIDPAHKKLEVKNLSTGEVFSDTYDKLIIATGARAAVPPIKGADGAHVFTLRNIGDMNRIKAYLHVNRPREAVIVGTGFIGLEVCENLKKLGINVTMIEMLPQVTPGLDADMAAYVQDHLKKNNVAVMTGVSAAEITADGVVLSNGDTVQADMVLLSTGVRPNTELARAAGIELGIAGAIKVNTKMETNVPDIFACGDCTEQFHLVTGKPVYRPLGSTANKTGRITGDRVTGGDLEFRGILGTGIFRVFEMTVAQTGLSEKEAREQGYDVTVCHNIKPNRPEYMGGKEMVIKGIADRATGRLLGVQIVGYEGVDKRIDVFATAITFGARAEDLFHLDLAYAPPFSTTKDPVMYTGMILDNAIRRDRPLMTAQDLEGLMQSGQEYALIDTRTAAQYQKDHIQTAVNIQHSDLREAMKGMDKDMMTVTYCNKGTTGNAAQNILKKQRIFESVQSFRRQPPFRIHSCKKGQMNIHGGGTGMVEIFKALAEESRLRILALLLHDELCVCEIEESLRLTQSNASRHLTALKSCGIVESSKKAQWAYYKISETFKTEYPELWSYLERQLSSDAKYRADCEEHIKCRQKNMCGEYTDGQTTNWKGRGVNLMDGRWGDFVRKNKIQGIGFFEKFLTVWVLLCMAAGVLIGRFLPGVPALLNRFEYAKVSIPVAILIWVMIYPMMMKVDFQSIRNVGRNPKGLFVTWIANWLIKPFTMYALASFFLYVAFKGLIAPDLAKEYLAGAILLGVAPCTAMVFVWSLLTKGNPAYTVVQVATNDLIILIAFVPIVKFLLGISDVQVPWDTLILSVVLFVVIPLSAGVLTRMLVTGRKGIDFFEKQFLPKFNNITIVGLLLTLILLFAFQGEVLLNNPLHIVLIAIPLTIQTFLIFFHFLHPLQMA